MEATGTIYLCLLVNHMIAIKNIANAKEKRMTYKIVFRSLRRFQLGLSRVVLPMGRWFCLR